MAKSNDRPKLNAPRFELLQLIGLLGPVLSRITVTTLKRDFNVIIPRSSVASFLESEDVSKFLQDFKSMDEQVLNGVLRTYRGQIWEHTVPRKAPGPNNKTHLEKLFRTFGAFAILCSLSTIMGDGDDADKSWLQILFDIDDEWGMGNDGNEYDSWIKYSEVQDKRIFAFSDKVALKKVQHSITRAKTKGSTDNHAFCLYSWIAAKLVEEVALLNRVISDRPPLNSTVSKVATLTRNFRFNLSHPPPPPSLLVKSSPFALPLLYFFHLSRRKLAALRHQSMRSPRRLQLLIRQVIANRSIS
jgi:hypothetical protein